MKFCSECKKNNKKIPMVKYVYNVENGKLIIWKCPECKKHIKRLKRKVKK